MGQFAVLDVLMRAFVTDREGRWRFASRRTADELRSYEYERKGGCYLIVDVDGEEDPTSAIERVPFRDGESDQEGRGSGGEQ